MTERTEKSLRRILEHAVKIISYTNGYNFDCFVNDAKTLEAVVFNLSQIGELVSLIDDYTKKKHTGIDWISIKGLRNRIVHDYE